MRRRGEDEGRVMEGGRGGGGCIFQVFLSWPLVHRFFGMRSFIVVL